MKTYVTKLIRGSFVSYPEEIDSNYWEGQIGSTYEDFLNGKWVLLNDNQTTFHNEHPEASAKEVFNMELDASNIIDPIKEAKERKLAELSQYDNGSDVNDFTVNGQLHAWFDPETRSNYRNSIDAAKLLNIDNLQVFIGGTLVTLSTTAAEQMLAAIQLYADQCYIATKQHEANIEMFDNVGDINNYDFTTGYPSKLNFTI